MTIVFPRLVILALFCFAQHTTLAQTDPAKPLASGDQVFVQVYRHPELSSAVTLDDTGNIELPYVGRVAIGGVSETEASQRVTTAFGSVLKNPRVTVSRKAQAALPAPVLGAAPRTEQMDTKVVPLNNANAATLNTALAGMSTAGGSVSYDPSTNSMILTDTPATLMKMVGVIKELDSMQSQIMQVHIEAKIVEVESTAARETGVRWFAQGDNLGGGYLPNTRQDTRVDSARRITDPIANERARMGDRNGSTREFVRDGTWDRRIQFPVQVPLPGQFALGFMNNGIDLGTLIDALVAENKAQMLASPYIRTVNHQKAEIRMTEEFPFAETNAVGLSSVSSTRFLNVGIILEVTPHVRTTPQGERYVQLELQPEVSSTTGVSNGVPVRSVRSSKSIADVLDAQTLVIGGIANNDSRNVVQKVPGVGNMPLLGALFRHKERSKQSRELMIFVTPHIFDQPGDVTTPPPPSLSRAAAATDVATSGEDDAKPQPKE